MLQVTYEAVDLAPGRLACIDEDRGRIEVSLDKNASLEDVIRQLNVEIDKLLTSSEWFQLWETEIVSRCTPGAPLRITYLIDPEEEDPVEVFERKGLVTVHINPSLSPKEFAAAMNPVTDEFLDAGQWFQLYAGEIVDNDR
ncbi:hypothetical protein [Streptomyces flavidovirens]